MTMKRILLISAMLLTVAVQAQVSVGELRTERLCKPLNVERAQPRLSWEIASGDRGVMQTAYRVLVASSPEMLDKDNGELWDSGRVSSD